MASAAERCTRAADAKRNIEYQCLSQKKQNEAAAAAAAAAVVVVEFDNDSTLRGTLAGAVAAVEIVVEVEV